MEEKRKRVGRDEEEKRKRGGEEGEKRNRRERACMCLACVRPHTHL